jgi:hypothetical protein
MTPIDDETLASWQRQVDALISDIDDLLADIAAEAEGLLVAANKIERTIHLGGSRYE